MSDKTQLEQIAELLVGHCFMPPDHDLDTGDMELEMARNVAQQILDICQPQWIDMPELPETDGNYLTKWSDGEMEVFAYNDEYRRDWESGIKHLVIIKWMPLPEDTA